MRRFLFVTAALFGLLACNSELGPEYKTAPIIGKVTYTSNETVLPTQTVTVSAPITSQYGLKSVFIAYELNGDTDNLKNTIPYNYTKHNTDITFTDALPKQAAGTKVRFQIFAYSAYNVVSVSEICEYKVAEESEVDPLLSGN